MKINSVENMPPPVKNPIRRGPFFQMLKELYDKIEKDLQSEED
jgi:hypothetical protein